MGDKKGKTITRLKAFKNYIGREQENIFRKELLGILWSQFCNYKNTMQLYTIISGFIPKYTILIPR